MLGIGLGAAPPELRLKTPREMAVKTLLIREAQNSQGVPQPGTGAACSPSQDTFIKKNKNKPATVTQRQAVLLCRHIVRRHWS